MTSAKGFFLNGGKRFIILNLGERPSEPEEVKSKFREGLNLLDGLEDIPFVISPGEHDPEIHSILIESCEKRGTYAILDGPMELVEKKVAPPEEPGEGADEAPMGPSAAEPGAATPDPSAIEPEEEKYENLPEVKSDKGLVVFPWIYFKDRVMGDFYIPPTGHVAGILNRKRGISFLRYPTKHPGLMLHE
jgi:hypothetical protein